jgi:thioesterase domain-containing protein
MGHTPRFLGMIDSINPRHDLVPLNNDVEMLIFLIELLEGKEIQADTAEKFFSKTLEQKLLKSIGLNILPDKEQQKNFEQIQQNLNSLKHYFPEAYHGDVAFFEAKDRFFRMKDIPLTTTWHSLIKGKIATYEIPGGHLNILQLPHLISLANQLDLSLEQVLKNDLL